MLTHLNRLHVYVLDDLMVLLSNKSLCASLLMWSFLMILFIVSAPLSHPAAGALDSSSDHGCLWSRVSGYPGNNLKHCENLGEKPVS